MGKCLFNRYSLPGKCEKNFLATISHPASQSNGNRNVLNQFFTFFHESEIIGTRSIPFQEGKFRDMLTSPFALSPATTDLKDFVVAGCKHPFHADFRGGVKKPCA